MDFWFLIAGALLSFIGMLFHGIAGHQKYIGNINNSALEPLAKSLSLVSWHMFTIFLFVSTVSLVYVAYSPTTYFILYPVISINILGSFLFILLGALGHKRLLTLPGAYLTGFTAFFAYLGL
tara:strand:+ start:1506 stop:1871 length:366 start_codon:yes stop_codon:yes gene_type:complete